MTAGECTIDKRDFIYARGSIHDAAMHAAAAKGMPVDGVISPKLKPGITYTTTHHPDGTIHVRWEPVDVLLTSP